MNDFVGHRVRPSRVAGAAGGGFPHPLNRGDRVAVVATGFAVRPELLDAGLARLARWGFTAVPGGHVRACEGYLAGTDAERIEDLNRALADRDARAVWFARGGYGTARLLDFVDWKALRRRPKVLVGFSDLTALFLAAWRHAHAPSLHGPTVADLAAEGAWHAPSLRAALAGRGIDRRLAQRDIVAPGRARGPLLGGNLSVIAHLVGTPHMPSLAGAVVLLEDAGEESYRLDRMLNHLDQSGSLDGVAAVVLGWFDAPPARRAYPPDRPAADVLRERFGSRGIPVVHVPTGHRRGKWTLPLGATCLVDTTRRIVRFGVPR